MKKNHVLCLLLLLIIFTLYAYQKSEGNGECLPLEVYKKVLENKVDFFSTDDKKYVCLNEVLNRYLDYSLKVRRFTVLDMDGDKIPEVVLELSCGEYGGEFEILHYMNGMVYGYNIPYRGLLQLKTDGTSIASGGAADNYIEKIRFSSNGFKYDVLGYSESSWDNDVISISYYIDNKQVTEESFKAFCNQQNVKEDVVWYKFSSKNIETQLSIYK